MIPIPIFLLSLPALGIALSACVALARHRFPGWSALVLVVVSAFLPILLYDRTDVGQTIGRSLWEWTAAGGPKVQAAYHVDALALVAAAIVALATGATIHRVARLPEARPLAIVLIALDGIALVALVAMTDVVAAIIVAGMAAAIAVAVALFVATASAAARLAALLALGLQSFTAAALLLASYGIATFDLEEVPAAAIAPGVLTAVALGAALFCGLYPFVPWRYEAEAVTPLGAIRGVALFPIGLAGSIVALRMVAAAGVPATELALPDLPPAWQAALLLVILGLTALAARSGPRSARLRRALTGAAFFGVAAALPALGWGHVVALLALLTVLYAAVGSAAVVAEWDVARFDIRLGVLWAAIASGAPLALMGALLGLLASALALALELAAVPAAARIATATSARVLAVFGPFFALAGLYGTPDPVVAVLCGSALGVAGLLELAHAVRETQSEVGASWRARSYATLAALAVVSVVGVASLPTVVRAAGGVLDATPAVVPDVALAGAAALTVVLTILAVALPRLVRVRVSPRLLGGVRRVLTATDPVPVLALTYRGLEEWSRRIGGAFAGLEDRAGVWVATSLIALTLLWAASS